MDIVKETWAKLRNAFIAAKKRRQTKSGQAAKKIPAWKLENEMSFLIPYLEMRNTQSNLEKRPLEEEQQQDNIENIEEQSQEEENENHNQESQLQKQGQIQCFQKSLPSSTQPRRNQNPAQEMVQIMKENAAMRKKRYQEQPKMDLDETDMFYLSMAKTVKRLPPIEQANIRMQFCELVSKAEIRTLQGSGGSCSVSSVGSPPMAFSPCMSPHNSQTPMPASHSFIPPPFMSPSEQPASEPTFPQVSQLLPYIPDYQGQQS